MPALPADTIAMRREMFGAFVAFVAGFASVAVGLTWLFVALKTDRSGVMDVVGLLIHGLELGVIGGLAAAWPALRMLQQRHYRLGMYRCPYCERPLRSWRIPCDCAEIRALLSEAVTRRQGQ